MWVADMDFETPDFIRDAVIERSKHPIYGYTFRSDGYYQSIIDWQKKRYDWQLKKDWIVPTPGIVPSLNFLIQTFTKPGDKVIVQPPVYFPFFTSLQLNKRQPSFNQLIIRNERYEMDFADLRNKAREAKMLFLCNPHNPVSRCWNEEELAELTKICLENNVMIVSDEIHCDLVLPGYKHIPLATLSENIAEQTITCIAPSKTFNLAGMATSSVIISNDKWREKFNEKIEELHLAGGNLFGMVASEAAYKHGEIWLDEMLNYVNENFKFLNKTLEEEFETLQLVEPEGTYLAWIDFKKTGLSDDQIKERLIKKAELGLSHGPLFGPGGEGYQRMNVASPRFFIEEAIGRLRDYFD